MKTMPKVVSRYRMRVVGMHEGEVQFTIERRGWFGWSRWRELYLSKPRAQMLLAELREQEEQDLFQLFPESPTAAERFAYVAPAPVRFVDAPPVVEKSPPQSPSQSKG